MSFSVSMRRLGLVLAGTLVLAACNDGDVTAPVPPTDDNSGPPVLCMATSISTNSPNGERTCTWNITTEGAAGQPINGLDCGDGDCPGQFVCRDNEDGTGAWTATSLTCPNELVQMLPPPAGESTVYVTLNGEANARQVMRLNKPAPTGDDQPDYTLDMEYTFNSRENQGSAIDGAGHFVNVGDGIGQGFNAMGQADPTQNAPGLITACRVELRGGDEGNAYDADLDRQIRGAFNNTGMPPSFQNNPGLVAPKGMVLIPEAGLAVIADFGTSASNARVRALGLSAHGNRSAVQSFSTPQRPWDVAYDAANDRLYVAFTNGTIGQYDNAALTLGAGTTPGLVSIITPVDAGSTKVSVNLHGIVYEPESDSLIVSDVGDAMVDDDGQIFVLSGVSERTNDRIVPSRTIAGAATQLGNPVDIVLNGRDLLVAEKAQDFVLVFEDILTETEVNAAPDQSIAQVKPESLALAVVDETRVGVSDINDPNVANNLSQLLVSIAAGNTIRVQRHDAETFGLQATFQIQGGGLENISSQNVTVGLGGEVIVMTGDDLDVINGPTGGFVAISGFLGDFVRPDDPDDGDDFPGFEPNRDRRFSASTPNPTIGFPRGVDLAPNLGVMFVADQDAGNVKVLSACGNGAVLDTLNVESVTSGETDVDDPPWDVDYDPEAGDLYVAMTNGRLAVFRGIDNRIGTNPDYSFVVELESLVDGVPEEVGQNLHGVEFVDLGGDAVLILSDVGDANAAGDDDDDADELPFNQDGKIFILRGARSLGTTKEVNVTISGVNAGLGNPVDIAFDGANLWVAEKANQQVLRFDNILSSAGGEIAPSASFPAGSVESISLVPEYLLDSR